MLFVYSFECVCVRACMQGAALEHNSQLDGCSEEPSGGDGSNSRRGRAEHEERPVSGALHLHTHTHAYSYLFLQQE